MLILLTPLLIMQVTASWVFYDRHWQVVTKRLSAALAAEIQAIVLLSEKAEKPSERQEIFALAAHTMRFKVSYHTGSIPKQDDLPWRWLGPSQLQAKLAQALTHTQRDFSIDESSIAEEVLVHMQLKTSGYLTVFISRKRLFSNTFYIFFIWFISAGFLLFGLAGLFWRNQVRPIRRLAKAAEAFGKGREVAHFHPEGATEVRQAALAFIGMRDRLKRQISQRTRMLAGVSHDLRTPLTRMKLSLAMSSDPVTREALETEIKDMEAMITGYLAFARGEGSEALSQVCLKNLVQDVVEAYHSHHPAANLVLKTKVESASMLLRPLSIRRALDNLISNAMRYGTRVQIRLEPHQSGFVVHVDDDGPGIPAMQREDVVQPFFRMDESRNESTGGVGLGLSIATDIALAHGGQLALSDAPLGGLRVSLYLPR